MCEGVWFLVLNPKGYFNLECLCVDSVSSLFLANPSPIETVSRAKLCSCEMELCESMSSSGAACSTEGRRGTSIPVRGVFGVDHDVDATAITHLLTHAQCRLDGYWGLQTDEDEVCGGIGEEVS